ncbi:E3 ubiquitin-protein ligase NEURL3-like isoform X2 [Gouania willdenowi]|uniref:E3 ubiquitin-protein ligase NEURL3-like isoform X2 n=1 Tax=Gouania willdenowi TaxID=441366 RepID=UPI001054B1E6|nr:E3 ubiquitin-protein ligase NEURL3-like isoform X2 [Gouania willdenowi]
MMKEKKKSSGSNDVTPKVRHRCCFPCLGPLTFHPHAVGDMVTLSHTHRVAKRSTETFRNGLVFSSRPVKLRERVRVRVEKDVFNWHGSLRVGFTNVSPSRRALPLPCTAIPNLTDTPGHWAAALPESYCRVGSQLDFWVSHDGSIYIMSNSGDKEKLLNGVDLKQPLWALIDIYGQAYSICLLGSEKRGLVSRKSCPAPAPAPAPEPSPTPQYIKPLLLASKDSNLDTESEDMSYLDLRISEDQTCVVCMVSEARITLPCGHRCLCTSCNNKVLQQFGTCPLCRHDISSSSMQRCATSEPRHLLPQHTHAHTHTYG